MIERPDVIDYARAAGWTDATAFLALFVLDNEDRGPEDIGEAESLGLTVVDTEGRLLAWDGWYSMGLLDLVGSDHEMRHSEPDRDTAADVLRLTETWDPDARRGRVLSQAVTWLGTGVGSMIYHRGGPEEFATTLLEQRPADRWDLREGARLVADAALVAAFPLATVSLPVAGPSLRAL